MFFVFLISYFFTVVAVMYIWVSLTFDTTNLCQHNYAKLMALKYELIGGQNDTKPGNGNKVHIVQEKRIANAGIFQDLVLGIELQVLIDSFANYLGVFFFIMQTVDIITGSVSAYLAFLIPLSGSGNAFNPRSFMVGLGSLFLMILAMSRTYGLMRLGHSITTGNIVIRNVLQQISVTEDENMTNKERRTMDVLLDRTSNPTPLSPFNLYGVNFSTGLSILGISFTYIIVLLQFRFGEK